MNEDVLSIVSMLRASLLNEETVKVEHLKDILRKRGYSEVDAATAIWRA